MRTRAVLAVALLVLAAGCTGSGFAFDASPASVDGDALASAGYDGEPPEKTVVNETVAVGGVEADVTATTWTAGYTHEEQPSSLIVVSTPDAQVAGQSVNPLARLSNEELIERAVAQADGEAEVRNVSVEATANRTVLGTETEVVTYSAVVENEQGELPVRLHVASVTHEDDVVLAVGLHPETVDERATLLELMGNIEH